MLLTTHNTNQTIPIGSNNLFAFSIRVRPVYGDRTINVFLAGNEAENEKGQVFMIGHGQSWENSAVMVCDWPWPITNKRSAKVQQSRQRREKTWSLRGVLCLSKVDKT